jgi:hypothetical protein
VHFLKVKIEFYNVKGQIRGFCPLTFWFTLSFLEKNIFRGFVCIKIISISFYHSSPIVRRLHWLKFALYLGNFVYLSFATVSCDGLYWLLDEEVRCYLSWRLFLAFVVVFSWLKGVYLVNAWTR